jgi:hypothetical protein
MQVLAKEGEIKVLLSEFHRRTNLFALLFNNLGPETKKVFSEFSNLTSLGYLPHKF